MYVCMYVCMYVWSFFLALRGQNGPYLQLVDRFVFPCMFEVCVLVFAVKAVGITLKGHFREI